MTTTDEFIAELPFATVAVDAEGCVTVWDQGAVDLIGHRSEEIVGRSVEAIVPPEYRDRHRAGFERAMAGGERSADAAPFFLPVLRADHTIAVFAARFVFLDGPYGRLLGAMILVQPTVEPAEAFTPVPARDAETAPR
jgi:PAS domain S-box-containing protein